MSDEENFYFNGHVNKRYNQFWGIATDKVFISSIISDSLKFGHEEPKDPVCLKIKIV